ncbi:MAG TPA: hypothetical protein VKT27_16075 [Candidatus Binataceae bacterium]|nr:hypothetical protein [Candidatus Binataceae bacterium]
MAEEIRDPSTAPAADSQSLDDLDPRRWHVPIVCKDCDKPFAAPYRNFHAGVVFHCPACQGSWVPNTTIARGVRRVFENFFAERRRAREAFARGESKLTRDQFERAELDQLEAFRKRLERMAAELRPAGKLVRPKGIAAMFT